ncbi:MAG TPA: bifunctional 2-polyprenyl-6-hydroxyphenol methylase/3-demethylubiquinol 3-O-methyltransferase UbiG [Rhizomicrobium sp.]|jgi:2-polyprenyl-6-hydroxyphenyl methylase/3-demethylubiquinone-9 3-methyltransferase
MLTRSPSSVDAAEVEKFTRLAEQWWDHAGSFAPLHKFNPIRLQFIRDETAEHFDRSARTVRPFEGLSLLDLGCGGGLLAEPMARLGFAVTGCDASDETIRAATAHAEHSGLSIEYRCATAEDLAARGEAFDVVLNMEVVEHVPDVAEFLRTCAKLVRPRGLMFVATINKTLKSLALAKLGAEYVLRWLPPGTHDWNRFIAPARLKAALEDAGLQVRTTQGMIFNPLTWNWELSRDTDVNYAVVATRP